MHLLIVCILKWQQSVTYSGLNAFVVNFLFQTLFVEQLKKYDQLKGYIEQNLLAQGNILKALTDANVQYAPVRKTLTLTEQQYVFCISHHDQKKSKMILFVMVFFGLQMEQHSAVLDCLV